MVVHEGFNKSEIAVRYYEVMAPGKYDRMQAKKRFHQDLSIDCKVILKVMERIMEEQKRMI